MGRFCQKLIFLWQLVYTKEKNCSRYCRKTHVHHLFWLVVVNMMIVRAIRFHASHIISRQF